MQQNRKHSGSYENTTPQSDKMQSETVMEAAETLITLQQKRDPTKYSSDQIIQKGNVRTALKEKINIIENIQWN